MPLSTTAKAQLQIHFCVILWGFTAIFGKLISLAALPLVWWRMLIVVVVLIFVPRVWIGMRTMSRKLIWAYAGVGILLALHWLTFYGAIKLANASVAATCLALGTIFTALIEPKIAGRPLSFRELGLGILVLPGVALVVGGVPHQMRLGIAVGAVSALFVALFGSFNKRLVSHGDPLAVTAIEFGAGTLSLTLLAPLMPWLFPSFAGNLFVLPSLKDGTFLLILVIFCTLLPFVLSLVALRHMSAFATQLALNLEPVYAILLAILLLNEQRELGVLFYIGVAVILAAVCLYPMMRMAEGGSRRSEVGGRAPDRTDQSDRTDRSDL